MRMRKLVTDDFLDRAAQELPSEFQQVSVCACEYVKIAIDSIGQADKTAVREARGRLGTQYEFLVAAAKARRFSPAKAIGPFDIVNFQIR